MQKTLPLALLFASATAINSQAALVWTVGLDDNGWPFTAANPGNGGGPNATFVQEAGINPLPGNPASPEVNQQADDDYYFAGIYNTVIPSNGTYTPVGVVGANEEATERAFAGTDNDKRYHFNLPMSLQPNDTLSLTFDFNNIDLGDATRPVTNPRYGVEVYFNNILVMPQIIVTPAQINANMDFTTPQFSLASVGAVTGAGADNIVTLKGVNYNASSGGNWMGIDYVQLDSQVVPEPTAGLMLLFGAVGLTPFIRCRRS